MSIVELPDFVTPALVEHCHRRAIQMQAASQRPATRRYALAWYDRGVKAARRRDPKLLKFLDLASERIFELMQPQLSRFSQQGHESFHKVHGGEFTEFSQWKHALLTADEKPEDTMPEVFGWFYGAVSEAIFGTL